MENADDLQRHVTDLEEENQQLRQRLNRLEYERQLKSGARQKSLRFVMRTFAGKPLYNSVSKFVDEAYELNVQKETVKDFMYAISHRLTKVGMVTLMFATMPLVLAILQTYYLKKQNEKLDIQNHRIDQQTYLQEAERRSSLVFLFDNVLDKLDDELKENSARNLSPQLVGRIVALSKALKPYRYLDGDTLIGRPSSPERGQLLLSLYAAQLSKNTYTQIFSLADFSYAALDNINLERAYLQGINLSNATLNKVSMAGADLSFSNLEGATIVDSRGFLAAKRDLKASFNEANFHNSQIRHSNFNGCSFERTNFSGAWLQDVYFHEALLVNTRFIHSRLDSLDFSDAVLLGVDFEHDKLQQHVVLQLEKTRVDTASFYSLTRLPLGTMPQVDFSKPKFRIVYDTFFIDDRTPFIVADSFKVFELLSK